MDALAWAIDRLASSLLAVLGARWVCVATIERLELSSTVVERGLLTSFDGGNTFFGMLTPY
jgi:hypothetical protein